MNTLKVVECKSGGGSTGGHLALDEGESNVNLEKKGEWRNHILLPRSTTLAPAAENKLVISAMRGWEGYWAMARTAQKPQALSMVEGQNRTEKR